MVSKGISRIKGYMFRYIYPLNKKAKRLLKKSTMNWTLGEYPKDDSLEWFDATVAPKKKIDQPKFVLELENIKYNSSNVGNSKTSLEQFFS